jgi:hypothetical protein
LRTPVRPAANGSPAAHLPTIAIDRGDTHESGDATAMVAEFGQIGDQRSCGDVADAWP